MRICWIAFALFCMLCSCEQTERSNNTAHEPSAVEAETGEVAPSPYDGKTLTAYTFSGPAQGSNIQIMLPEGFSIEGSVIYNRVQEKVGEFSPGLLTPTEGLSNSDVLSIIAGNQALQAEELQIDFSSYESELIDSGSLTLSGVEWQYAVKRETYDGEDTQGIWNAYTFAALFDGKVLLISFYDKGEAQRINIDQYTPVLQTIEVR